MKNSIRTLIAAVVATATLASAGFAVAGARGDCCKVEPSCCAEQRACCDR